MELNNAYNTRSRTIKPPTYEVMDTTTELTEGLSYVFAHVLSF
jgi:hypothetical protein